MTRYERDMYEREIPSIRKSLEKISESFYRGPRKLHERKIVRRDAFGNEES